MLPWGHVAVGYLAYSLGTRIARHRPPVGAAVVALVVGTQAPDLVDKPLMMWTGLLPSGRSLGHSLLFVVGCTIGLRAFGNRLDCTDVGVAFVVGQLTHLVTDALPAILARRWSELGFLLWPITPAPQYSAADRILTEYLLTTLLSPPHGQLLLFVTAVGLWIVDGRPGIDTARSWARDRSRVDQER